MVYCGWWLSYQIDRMLLSLPMFCNTGIFFTALITQISQRGPGGQRRLMNQMRENLHDARDCIHEIISCVVGIYIPTRARGGGRHEDEHDEDV